MCSNIGCRSHARVLEVVNRFSVLANAGCLLRVSNYLQFPQKWTFLVFPLNAPTPSNTLALIDSGLVGWLRWIYVFTFGGGTQEKKTSQGHLPRAVCHQEHSVYCRMLIDFRRSGCIFPERAGPGPTCQLRAMRQL